MSLSERQLNAVAYLKKHLSITTSVYQSLTEVSKRTAIRELNDMRDKEIISKEETAGPGTLYKLKVP